MANLGTVPVIKAKSVNTASQRFTQFYITNMFYGASMLTAGLGTVSNNPVTSQTVVALPPQTAPTQYWS